MDEARERIGHSAWWLALPFLAAVAAYAPVLQGGFVWDDHALIENHPLVKQLAPLGAYFGRRFWSDPLDPSDSFYRPLVTLTYALEWKLWGGSPAGFHVTNLLAHLGVVALVVALCLRTGARGAAAAVPAAVFAVLPRLTESVAWISGRTDIFASLFGLSALLLYRPNDRGLGRAVGCGALLFAALLCKEVAFAFVAGLVVLEWAERRSFSRASVRRLLPALIAAALVLVARTLVSGPSSTGASGFEPPWPQRVVAVLASAGEYAWILLDAFRPRLQIGFVASPSPVMAIVGGVTAGALLWLFWRRRQQLDGLRLAFVAVGVLSVAMVLHLLPLNMPVIAADRFLYVPALAIAVLLARPLQAGLVRAPRVAPALAVVLVGLLAARAHARVLVWNDEYALWSRAVTERHPLNSGPLLALAGVLLDANLPERALVHLERELEEERAKPQLKTFSTYAVALSKSGRHEEAISTFEDLARKQPSALRVRLNLAMAYARAGRWKDAEAQADSLAAETEVAQVAADVGAQLREAARRTADASQKGGVIGLVEAASVRDELGATADAEKVWRQVLRSPEATPEQRQRALGQLAFFGEPGRVAADLEFARAAGLEISAFEAVRQERDQLR